MGILTMIVQFLLSLSIIVALHELGHLLFAKLFGMRVESYSIGFPPPLARFRWGETEYSIGAIPLGGRVCIAGMFDESLDTTKVAHVPQPWEFRAKPAWQRLIVVLGGIFFNLISGIVIYIALTFSLGDTYLSKEEVNRYGIVPNAVGVLLGFQEGDRIIDINGRDFEKFTDLFNLTKLLAAGSHYTVLRDEQFIRINIPADFIEQLSDKKNGGEFIAPRVPFLIGKIQPESGAAQAGLQPGDQIVEVAGAPISYFHQITALLAAQAGQKVWIRYVRSGTTQCTTAEVSKTGKLGFQPQLLLSYVKKNYSLGQAIVAGTGKTFQVIKTNLMALSKVLTGQLSPSKALSGPIGIVQVFDKSFNWIHFWNITGFLSLALAFTNLLPIPALDGGHTLWLLYELVTGRSVSDKFLIITQKVGMIILLLLIGYALINDLYKLF